MLPKGSIEPGETPQVAALRETFEETGVSGLIVARAGPTLAFRPAARHLAVELLPGGDDGGDALAGGTRKVLVCLPEDAAERITFQNARDLLKNAIEKFPPPPRQNRFGRQRVAACAL